MVLHLKVWESRSPPGLQNTAKNKSFLFTFLCPVRSSQYAQPVQAKEKREKIATSKLTRDGAARPPRRQSRQNKQPLPGESPVLEIDAGWSSPVARQAHNLKVAGSNPAPATNKKGPLRGAFFIGSEGVNEPAGSAREAFANKGFDGDVRRKAPKRQILLPQPIISKPLPQ